VCAIGSDPSCATPGSPGLAAIIAPGEGGGGAGAGPAANGGSVHEPVNSHCWSSGTACSGSIGALAFGSSGNRHHTAPTGAGEATARSTIKANRCMANGGLDVSLRRSLASAVQVVRHSGWLQLLVVSNTYFAEHATQVGLEP
jgi:hypothetical protein